MHPESLAKMHALREDIHRHPELGFDVHRTANIVAQRCRELGYDVATEVGVSGVVADLHHSASAPTIALRADMDALPIHEKTGLAFTSRIPGVAHLCGHDTHTAMLLGAAEVLANRRKQLKHNVRLLFQPHEEGLPGGAPAMIADGALEGVREIYGLHVWPSLATGHIGICAGAAMAQADVFSITIHGHGGHAALPHHTVDPIVIASQVVVAIQSIVARNIDPLDAAVVTIGEIHGGSVYNQIPNTCVLKGTVRTLSQDNSTHISHQLHALATHYAQAAGGSAELNYESGFPPVVNEHATSAHAMQVAATHGTVITPAPSMCGEDFAYYGQKIPASFLWLGCQKPERTYYPLHHPEFFPDPKALPIGAMLLADLGTRLRQV